MGLLTSRPAPIVAGEQQQPRLDYAAQIPRGSSTIGRTLGYSFGKLTSANNADREGGYSVFRAGTFECELTLDEKDQMKQMIDRVLNRFKIEMLRGEGSMKTEFKAHIHYVFHVGGNTYSEVSDSGAYLIVHEHGTVSKGPLTEKDLRSMPPPSRFLSPVG